MNLKKKILEKIKYCPDGMRRRELADIMDPTSPRIEKALEELISEGKVEKVVRGAWTFYFPKK